MVNEQTLSDKLELRAIKEGWPIKSQHRKEIIESAMVRATCGDPDIEDRAAKIILAADMVNLKRQQLEQKKFDAEQSRRIQLMEAAVKLGLVIDGAERAGVIGSQPSAG
jgi:hypothetical protein